MCPEPPDHPPAHPRLLGSLAELPLSVRQACQELAIVTQGQAAVFCDSLKDDPETCLYYDISADDLVSALAMLPVPDLSVQADMDYGAIPPGVPLEPEWDHDDMCDPEGRQGDDVPEDQEYPE